MNYVTIAMVIFLVTMATPISSNVKDKNSIFTARYTEDIYRLLHRKCDVRIFIHELQDFGKRTSERSERVSFQKSCNE